jgi:hypothetical protein
VHGRDGLIPNLVAGKVAWFMRRALRPGQTDVASKDGVDAALLEGTMGTGIA